MEDPMLERQIDDLRERMRLLQVDRHSNVEMTQTTKNTNKETIKKLRDDNKELRAKIKQHRVANGGGENKSVEDENQALQREVIKLRKQFDSFRLITSKNKKALQELKDGVKDLELDSQRSNQEDSPLTRNIRMLENRLDKAMIKYNEAQSIRKTYEQIVKRLKDERIGFDNQLAALERTYEAKQRDYEELVLLSGDANHAREVTSHELERVRAGYEEEKKRREKELRERHQELALRRQFQEKLKERNDKMDAIVKEEAGDLGAEGEDDLKSALVKHKLNHRQNDQEKLEQKTKIDIFENAFRKIKDATGVSDVNEVIQKIMSQEGTTENLMLLTKENQARIENFNDQETKLRERVEEVKYSGPGGGHRRKLIDDKEEDLNKVTTNLDRSHLKYERLAKMLISVKAGVKHLQDKLAPVRHELGRKVIDLTDDSVVDVLNDNEAITLTLLNQMRAAQADDESLLGSIDEADHDEDLKRLESSMRFDEENEVALQSRPHNQRIELPDAFDWDHDAGGKRGDDGIPDVDEEELTRDKVKKASQQLLSQQEKKKKSVRRRGANT